MWLRWCLLTANTRRVSSPFRRDGPCPDLQVDFRPGASVVSTNRAAVKSIPATSSVRIV